MKNAILSECLCWEQITLTPLKSDISLNLLKEKKFRQTESVAAVPFFCKHGDNSGHEQIQQWKLTTNFKLSVLLDE